MSIYYDLAIISAIAAITNYSHPLNTVNIRKYLFKFLLTEIYKNIARTFLNT